ncbi:MAG TPA: glycosyltransferase family 4 protein [Terriglobales bacterium]|nr:glycosyltransferase family 4 protein [Terriglobales bacterium]
MPLETIDTASYRVRARYGETPSLVLLTDARELGSLPEDVRQAADQIWLGERSGGEPGPGPCGWLRWRAGERLREGNGAALRYLLTVANRRTYLPVHYEYGADWELIGVEPRVYSPGGGAREDSVDLRLRVGAAAGAGAAGWEKSTEPWQRLAAALRLESEQLGAGVAPLARLAQWPGLHPLLQSLCLRNLIVALLRQNETEQAATLLQQAQELHPHYRELDFVAAKLRLAQGRGGEAVGCLQRATRPAQAEAPLYVGSGGEAGYRAHHLLAVLAEHTGRQPVALHHFLTGVRHAPAFAPSVAGLLRQRVPASLFAAVQWELTRLGRREPEYQSVVFDFFLAHRAFEAAEHLLRVWPLAGETQATLQRRYAALAPLYRPSPRPPDQAAGVVLSGPLLMHASVARINRYLGAGLQADPGLEVALEPTLPGEEPLAAFPRHAAWSRGLGRLPRRLDLTIRHGWPPDFRRPATGRLALILPWEFGAIPREWLAGLAAADEVWVPSQFVRGVLGRAGVDTERVVVIPNGVDLELYAPQGERARPEGSRRVNFLFVGGAIRRKGLDLLLAAWREAFTAQDDVSLVIKDLGARSFYHHLNLRREIEALARTPGVAPIHYLGEDWSEARLPQLYRGCDVVVLPYRGEGFGMPLAEALACAKPVIATAAGPAPEFCPPEAAWLIPAREVAMPRPLWPAGELTGVPTWFEPDGAALVAALRQAAENPEENSRRGWLGAQLIRQTHGWEAITAQYRKRIVALLARTDAPPALPAPARRAPRPEAPAAPPAAPLRPGRNGLVARAATRPHAT